MPIDTDDFGTQLLYKDLATMGEGERGVRNLEYLCVLSIIVLNWVLDT